MCLLKESPFTSRCCEMAIHVCLVSYKFEGLLSLTTVQQYLFELYSRRLCPVSNLLGIVFLLKPNTQLHCLGWRLIQADFRLWFVSVWGILKSLNSRHLNFFFGSFKTFHLLSERLLHSYLTAGEMLLSHLFLWVMEVACKLLTLRVSCYVLVEAVRCSGHMKYDLKGCESWKIVKATL